MDVVVKTTGTVTPVEDSKSKHGEFDVVLSTNALDRDGDELHADEWKTPLPDKITFDSDHGMSVATCVGSGTPFINDSGQLQVRGTFASTPHGQAVRTLVNEGHITSVSVAFMEHKNQKSGTPLRELLNGAFVAVPANPEARVLSSKAQKDAANWRDNTMAAIASMFDGGTPDHKYLQGVHDLAVKLGAGCPYSDPQAQPDVLQSSNRGLNTPATTKSSDEEQRYTIEDLFALIDQRWSTNSSPSETTEELTAPTADAAGTVDESADDMARAKALLISLELDD